MAPLPMATVCSLTSPRGGPGVLTVGDGLKSPVAEVEVSKAIPSFEAEGVGQAFLNTLKTSFNESLSVFAFVNIYYENNLNHVLKGKKPC
jgi:hypothetical protein